MQSIDETITGLDVWHLALPVVSRRDHGIGTVADKMEVVVVRLTSHSGVTGYGEAAPWSVFTGTPEANFAAIDRYFRPQIVGSKVSDFPKLYEKLEKTVVHCTEAKAAVEAAFMDLAGKIENRPAWSYLGRKCRSEVPLSVSLANPDFTQDLELVERLQNDRVNTVKVKTGFRDDAFDVMRLEELRKRYPNLNIRVDYNQGLASDGALESVLKLDAFAPDFIEQPVVADDYETMALIADIISAPLLADESVFSPRDMKRAIAGQICDGVSVKIMKSGGMKRGLEIADIAGAAGIHGYGGDMFETGLAHLAGLHMIAAAPNISLGCEFYHATYYLVEDLLLEPFPIVDGMVIVPEGPGLGIEVNPDMLEKYCIRHSGGKR